MQQSREVRRAFQVEDRRGKLKRMDWNYALHLCATAGPDQTPALRRSRTSQVSDLLTRSGIEKSRIVDDGDCPPDRRTDAVYVLVHRAGL